MTFPESASRKARLGKSGGVSWTGQVPSAKWMTFYTKVLAKYAKEKGLTLSAASHCAPSRV